MSLEVSLKSGSISPSDFESMEVEEKKIHINDLPNEILDVILNKCGLSDLDRVSAGEACSLWGRLIRNPGVEVYGREVWEENFGYTIQEEIPLAPPGVEVLKTLFHLEGKLDKTVHTVFHGKVEDPEPGYMLALIPGGLTLNELIRLMQFPKSGHAILSCFIDDTIDRVRHKAVDQTCWVLFNKNVIKGSKGRTYAAQEALIKEETKSRCGLPEVIVVVACVALKHVKTGERILTSNPYITTRCVEKINGLPLNVGGFFRDKTFYVDGDGGSYMSLGVVPCQKFK